MLDFIMGSPKILIVDDDEDMLEAYSLAFSQMLIDVTTTPDPLEAVRIMSTTKFAVILSDLRMPVMTGVQLAAKIRADKLNRDAKVFIISGAVTDEAIEKLNRLGVVEVVEKPVDFSALTEKVREIVFQVVKKPLGYSSSLVDMCRTAGSEVLSYYLGQGLTQKKPFLKSAPLGNETAAAVVAANK
jgi:two-component system chemotaxis response regulator CheY